MGDSLSCPTLAALLAGHGADHAARCATCRALLAGADTQARGADGLLCADVEAFLSARVFGSGADIPREILAHLSRCDACMALARELESASGAEALRAASGTAGNLEELPIVPSDLYVRGDEIGRGGMGRIVQARDRRLGRSVAIKELLDDRLAARFEREARLTARLQHPAIVSVYEAGRWSDGEPFYAMKFVAGKPLQQVIAGKPSLVDRLALLPNFITVVEAMAYAHSERVIHRDLKPHNILIGTFGETVVIDWGLAKDLAIDVGAEDSLPYRIAGPSFTLGGAGTPAYMAPEQARGEEPDERVDVYALGATLHHLLAGAAPGQAALPEETPAELRAVLAKAMAEEPEARYPTAAELADELKRFQTGKLVSAHRYTIGDLARRWLRRHRALVGFAAASATLLAIGAAVAIQRIVHARALAEHTSGELLAERGRQELSEGQPARALAFLDGALQHDGDTPAVRFLVADATRRLGRLVGSFSVGTNVGSYASPDGRRLLVIYADGSARVVDVLTQRTLDELPSGTGRYGAFAPDGSAFLVGGCPRDDPGGATCGRALTVSRQGVRQVLDHPGRVEAAEFSGDGRSILSMAKDRIYRWEGGTNQPALELAVAGSLRASDISHDGQKIVAVTRDTFFVWERGNPTLAVKELAPCDVPKDVIFDPTGERVLLVTATRLCAFDARRGTLIGRAEVNRGPEVGETLHVGTSEDGAWIVGTKYGYGEMELQMWRGDTLEAGPTLTEAASLSVTHLSHGEILTGSADGVARILDFRGVELARFDSAGLPLRSVWLTADSSRLGAVDSDGVVRLWDASHRLRGPVLPDMTAQSLPYLPDGRLLFVSTVDGSVQLWNRAGPIAVLPGPGMRDGLWRVARRSPDGRAVLVAEPDGQFVRWDPATGATETLRTLASPPLIWVTGRGKRWVAGSHDHLTVYDDHGIYVATIPGHVSGELAESADDRWLAAVIGKDLHLWDLATGASKGVFGGGQVAPYARFSSDGSTLAWVSSKQGVTIHVVDVATGTERATIADNGVGDMRLAPDGSRLLAIEASGTATLWTADGQLLARFESRGRTASAFSPDGRLIAMNGQDGVVRVWEDGILLQSTALRVPAQRLAFSPDGEELFAAGSGVGWRWSVGRDARTVDEIHRYVGARVPFALVGSKLVPARPVVAEPEPAPALIGGALGPVVTLPCPPGAVPYGAPFPAGRAAWCVRPDGTLHGPLRVWDAGGRLVLDEAYADGRRTDAGSAEVSPPPIAIGGPPARLPWIVRGSMTGPELAKNGEDFGRAGYHMIDVAGYTGAKDARFAAIWASGRGPVFDARVDLGAEAYRALFELEARKGFRPVHVTGYEKDGVETYTAVFTEGKGTFIERHGMTLDECEKILAENDRSGYVPVDIAGYFVSGGVRFAVIWEKPAGKPPDHVAWAFMSRNDFQERFDLYADNGFLTRSVSGYAMGNQARYAAVFVKDLSRVWNMRFGDTGDAYMTHFNDFMSRGFAPQRINAVEIDGSERFAGIWIQPAGSGDSGD